MRDVKLGESLGVTYIISEGIEEGEEAVSNGTFTIDAAAQLNNKYSIMNRPMNNLTKQIVSIKKLLEEVFNV